MIRIPLNDNWTYHRLHEEGKRVAISLPHDAMIHEDRSPASAGGFNNSWFETFDYVYEKDFSIPKSFADPSVLLEFEGVYQNAEVYVNEKHACSHAYGYVGFHVDVTAHLIPNAVNHLKVIVRNSEQPNSRWYSGAGIYRPVSLFVAEKDHIEVGGVKIKTVSHVPAVVEIAVKTTSEGEVSIALVDDRDVIVGTVSGHSTGEYKVQAAIPDAKLWSPTSPSLYRCRVRFNGDTAEETFGIRIIQCDSRAGFRLNGERIILRGACIHHDNGLLGACAYGYAEERKIRLLQESGYNAIRSAHNPCSKALLDACDGLGMLVMDEYVDMWYIHKTKFDYAALVERNYPEDIGAMVDKDYNHPSVIMYSIGNEVSETSERRGIDLTGKMTDACHRLDDTRPVTCGVNIFFNYLYSLGFGVYSDKKAAKKQHVGSEFFNHIAGIFGDKFMKLGATLKGCDRKTKDAFAKLDVAGYNYGILRYERDIKKYPDRVIVGTETFCKDAYRFYELAKKHPSLIGDFVWAGMDYLGEVGVGAWEYKDYAPDFDHGVGWMTAGSGRIDATGRKTAEAAYTRVAFDLDKIRMAVRPVGFSRKRHSPSAWKMTNAIESWSWNGCGGHKATIEVYARAHRVALSINGEPVGMKRVRKGCRVAFSTRYADGEVTAIALDRDGDEIARTSLATGTETTVLALLPEENALRRQDLCYVGIGLTDDRGTIKPRARAEVKVAVQGGTLLGLGNGCPFNRRGYTADITDTYYGQALAIIQPDGDSGKVIVDASCAYGAKRIEIPIV